MYGAFFFINYTVAKRKATLFSLPFSRHMIQSSNHLSARFHYKMNKKATLKEKKKLNKVEN